MKNKYFLIGILILLFNTKEIFTQKLKDVLTDLIAPKGLALSTNELFITEGGKIIRIDVRDKTPVPNTVIAGLQSPQALVLNKNDLYIADRDKIIKIDIREKSPVPSIVIAGLGAPIALALNENDLYIAEYTESKISKIDISIPNSHITKKVIVNNAFAPVGLALNGNDLYFGQLFSQNSFIPKIYKIDITTDSPSKKEVIALENLSSVLAINGNHLYVSTKPSFSPFVPNPTSKILKVDITKSSLSFIEVINDLQNPHTLVSRGDIFYLTESGKGKVLKFNERSLSVETSLVSKAIRLMPIPSSSFIQISNLKSNESYQIFDISGKKIKNGTINSSDNQINIRDIKSGTYLLKLGDKLNMIKFIKE